MANPAIALLRMKALENNGGGKPGVRTTALDDALLLHTGADFSASPAELAEAIREATGEAIYDHEDERGIFVFPQVARSKATTYDAVIADVGDLGMWVDPDADLDDEEEGAADGSAAGAGAEDVMGLPAGLDVLAGGGGGDLGALLNQMMSAIGPGTLEALQSAMASDDPAELERVQQRMHSAIAQLGDPEELARKLSGVLDESQLEELREAADEAQLGRSPSSPSPSSPKKS